MKFAAYIFGLFAAVASASYPTEEGVLVLGEDNFEDAIKEHTQILVEFYAPWCGHCKQLAPEWAKAAQALAESPVKLAKVDATEHDALAKQFDIKGFPTIKFLKNGKPSDYNGGRTSAEIINWVNKKSGPAAATISNADELTKFQETHEAFALGVFDSADSENAKAFLALADSDENFIYALTTAAAVKTKLGVSAESVIVLKSFDDLRADHTLSGKFNEETVGSFIRGNAVPLVQTFTQEGAKKIFSNPITKHFLFFTDKNAPYHESTFAAYKAAATEHKGKLLFINVPHTENKILDYFGITTKSLPASILADLGSEGGIKKFPFTGAHESAAIGAFAESFLNGNLKPTLKSEEPAPEDTTGDVVVLKGKSFNDLVINNEKDVLVEFYAPWCGHCKKLAPTWDSLGEKFKGNDNIVIAKMDATANEVDVPGLAVKGFPTIVFFKGNDKAHPQKYEEGRELDDFVAFLKKNAHNSADHDEL